MRCQQVRVGSTAADGAQKLAAITKVSNEPGRRFRARRNGAGCELVNAPLDSLDPFTTAISLISQTGSVPTVFSASATTIEDLSKLRKTFANSAMTAAPAAPPSSTTAWRSVRRQRLRRKPLAV